MGVLKSKIFRDIWLHKGRTLQIVLIIGLSAGAIGMIMSTRSVFIPGMQAIWQSMNPAMINIYTGYVSEDELYVLKNVADITQIEGKSSTYIEWRTSPEEDWRQAGFTARIDYDDQILNRLDLVNGQWPAEDNLAVGQDAEAFFGISPGETIYIKLNDREMQVSLVGTVYDQLVQPAFLGGMAQLYASRDLYEKFVGPTGYNQILLSAAVYDEKEAELLAARFQEKLEKQGYDSGRLIQDPDKHLFQDQMDGIFMVLTVLGFFSLALGLLLVYNTVNVLIAQQVDQIGVMKAVGARTWQILRLYFITILVYGFLALAVALPMAIFGSNAIMTWLSTSLGSESFSFEVSPPAIYLMVFLTLVAPVLASLVPIIAGARITVREAISTYGLTTKPGLLERMLNKGRYISRLLLITISNTFRH
ncbi:MAG: ABC transporter permease, partial [Anaerolineales bacterium]|nr:ABC transporter permease [Anaerolineales bacterium]